MFFFVFRTLTIFSAILMVAGFFVYFIIEMLSKEM